MIKATDTDSSGYSIKEHQDIKYISFDILHRTGIVKHAFTTRLNGVSTGCLHSLNMAFMSGDKPEAVIENRKRVSKMLSYNLEDMVCGQQVHGVGVHQVTILDRGRGAFSYKDGIPNTDALITNEPNVLLASFYADCVPVFLVDPVKKAVGLVHAGWKGSVARIVEHALKAMVKAFDTQPGNCQAVIGPSIGSCCYEVNGTVLLEMEKQGFQVDRYVEPAGEGHWMLDLPSLNKEILINAGVAEDSVFLSGLCTACNQELFFSYRGQNGQCGRMASLVGLNS